jgi:hypothetical protein
MRRWDGTEPPHTGILRRGGADRRRRVQLQALLTALAAISAWVRIAARACAGLAQGARILQNPGMPNGQTLSQRCACPVRRL